MKQLLAAAALLVFSLGCQAKWHGEDQGIMGTNVSVTLWLEDDAKAEQAVQAVMDEMRRIDQQFSPYIETSELSRVNQLAPKANAKTPLKISAEMTAIIDKSLYYSRLSDGAFDITFASLGRYYDYRKKLKPSEQQREELLPLINYRFIHLDREANTVWFEHPGVYIDLGGIAKGYAVDRATEILQKKFGVMHANVTAGGDSRVIGDKFGRPWLVGIKNPRAEAVAVTLPLTDVSLSTSGDYERYFIDQNGERVHHILNPRTGKSPHGVNSVTILGPAGFDTDPMAKIVFILGPEKGLEIINNTPGFDAVIITSQGKVLYSKGMQAPE
ncbi:MAG TPA: FAD:protein FMN transferase [Cellvibrio sp.]|nr:FAD:protein FMN transferase [Cellvibrio sp.]